MHMHALHAYACNSMIMWRGVVKYHDYSIGYFTTPQSTVSRQARTTGTRGACDAAPCDSSRPTLHSETIHRVLFFHSYYSSSRSATSFTSRRFTAVLFTAETFHGTGQCGRFTSSRQVLPVKITFVIITSYFGHHLRAAFVSHIS